MNVPLHPSPPFFFLWRWYGMLYFLVTGTEVMCQIVWLWSLDLPLLFQDSGIPVSFSLDLMASCHLLFFCRWWSLTQVICFLRLLPRLVSLVKESWELLSMRERHLREPGGSGSHHSCTSLVSPYFIFQHITFTWSALCIQTGTSNVAAEVQIRDLNFSSLTVTGYQDCFLWFCICELHKGKWGLKSSPCSTHHGLHSGKEGFLKFVSIEGSLCFNL